MSFNAEKEIASLWKNLHTAQSEVGKTFYRWRRVALDLAGPDADPNEVSLKAAEVFGKDIGKSFLPRLNWLKGEEAFLLNLGRAYAGLWNTDGAVATAEAGENPGEVLSSARGIHGPPTPKNTALPWRRSPCTEKGCSSRFWRTSACSSTSSSISRCRRRFPEVRACG